jgi:heme-degrading monooxygenase HmoA
MSKVILLNPFEVPKEREQEALGYWEEAANLLKRAPGYISTALHQAIDDNARFRLINCAEWESPEAFYAAVQTSEFDSLVERNKGKYQYYPGLYRVIRTDDDLK